VLLVCDELRAEDKKARRKKNISYFADLDFCFTADAMKRDAIFLTF
jgi:hypothetical protein